MIEFTRDSLVQVGNKFYGECARCGRTVRINKPIFGAAHYCVTEEELRAEFLEEKRKQELKAHYKERDKAQWTLLLGSKRATCRTVKIAQKADGWLYEFSHSGGMIWNRRAGLFKLGKSYRYHYVQHYIKGGPCAYILRGLSLYNAYWTPRESL